MRFAICKGETRDGGRESGKAKPMTDEAGGKGLEMEMEVAPASENANDLVRTGGMDADTGAGVGAVVDPVDKISLVSGSAHAATISCVVPSRG